MIKHAREKRERMRAGHEYGKDDGFVPLNQNDKGPEVGDGGRWGESRLLTEDQEDGEEGTFDDAMGDRVGFGDPKERERQEARKRREAMDRHGAGDDEGDEEMMDWENDLIRKGTGQNPDDPMAKRVKKPVDDDEFKDEVTGDLEEVQKELRKALNSMQDMHEAHRREVTGMESELNNMKLEINGAEEKRVRASKKYELFQRVKDYMLDLLDCLDEKLPQIEDSEDVVLELRAARGKATRALEATYLQDTKDEMRALAGDADNEGEVDEFGRSRVEQRLKRREARKALRTIRNEIREEGWSSDEEDSMEIESFKKSAAEAHEKATKLFDDVEEKYSNMNAVKEHFMDWKREHPASYLDAYVSKSLPQIFSPFVRLELIKWEPLSNPEVDMGMAWFDALRDYGEVDGGMAPDDEDQDLVPRVVMAAAVPLVQDVVKNEWSPFSTSQTKRVVRLYKEITTYVDTTNDEIKDILREVRDMYLLATQDAVLPLLPKTTPGGRSFLNTVFERNCKLLHNLGRFDGLISSGALHRVAFPHLIDRLLLPYIQNLLDNAASEGEKNHAIKMAKHLVDAIPDAWFTDGLDAPKIIFPFIVAIQNLAKEAQKLRNSVDGWAQWDKVQSMKISTQLM